MKRILFLVVVSCLCLPNVVTWANEESNGRLSEYTLHVDSRVRDFAISPDGKRIVVLGRRVSGFGKADSEKKFREEITVWEWESGKPISSKLLLESPWHRPGNFSAEGGYVRFADNGAKLIVYSRFTGLLVLNPETLTVQQTIDVGASVRDLSVDSRGLRAALLVGLAGEECEIRVFDISTGTQLQKWPVQSEVVHDSISFDPAGKTLAVGIEQFSPGERWLRRHERNVFVYDVDSGRQLMAINTGYLVGMVRLTGDGTLLTVSGDDTHNNRDPLKIWNVRTGKLAGKITNPREGIHHAFDVSADGRVAAASIGLEQDLPPFLWLEGVSIHKNNRLRLWDLSTGKVLATTRFLRDVSEGAPFFRLSPDGKLLAVYDLGLLSIFKLNQEDVSSESPGLVSH